MEGDVVRACIDEVADDAVHRLDHEVHVNGRRDAVSAQGAQHRCAYAQVRHVVVVHHVEVHCVGTGIEHVSDLFPESGEVCGEDGRGDPVTPCHGRMGRIGQVISLRAS